MEKKINQKNQWFYIIGAVLLAFLARWKLFITKGVIGHNWDWNIPFLREQNQYALISVFFNWQETVFGSYSASRTGNLFLYLVGAFTNGEIQSKFILFIVCFLSLISSAVLLKYFSLKFLKQENTGGVILGSLVYALAPSVFNDFIGGQLIYLLGYSVLPLYLFYVFKIFDGKHILRYLFPFALVVLILSGAHHWFFSWGFLLSIYFIFYIKKFGKLLFITAFVFLVSFYLTFHFFSSISKVKQIMPVELSNFDNYAMSLKNSLQTIDKVFLGAGFADRNLFLNSLGKYKNIFFLTFYAFVIIVLGNLLLRYKELKDKKLFIWAIFLYLFGLFLYTAGKAPFGDLFIYLMRNIIYLRAFRTTFHFSVIMNISFAVIVSISISLIQTYKKQAVLLLGALIIFSRLPIFIEGDNGRKVLKGLRKDSLDVYQINPNYLNILKMQFEDPKWYRTWIIPMTFSPAYRETPYQKIGQGGDPEVIYSPKPLLDDFSLNQYTKGFQGYIERNLVNENPINHRLMGFLSFKNIIWRRDTGASFSSLAGNYDKNGIAQKFLEFKPIIKSEYIDYYDMENKYYLPHFYIPQNGVYIDGETSDLIDFISSPEYDYGSAVYYKKGNEYSNVFSKDVPIKYNKIILNTFKKDIVYEEELITYRPAESINLPFVPFKPLSLPNQLVEKKESIFLTKQRNNHRYLLNKYLFLANKNISEIIKFGGGIEEFDYFQKNYSKNMNAALDSLKLIEVLGYKDFVTSLAIFRNNLFWQYEQLENIVIDENGALKINAIFSDINKRYNEMKPAHELEEFEYNFKVPKTGEYKIYLRDLGNISGWKFVSEDTILTEESGNWKLIEEEHFTKGDQSYILENPYYQTNLIGNNMQINKYFPSTIYKISFKYKTDSKMINKNSMFSINESDAGNLFNYYLFPTGNEFYPCEIYFRSSVNANKAFMYISVDEFKDLKIERVGAPDILLKSEDKNDNVPNDNIPLITFTKINPTKYYVDIKNATTSYTLVFNEGYYAGWKIYLSSIPAEDNNEKKIVSTYFDGKVNEKPPNSLFLKPSTFETWKLREIADDRHFLVNGYANGWRILPEDANGVNDYRLIVEFVPQRMYMIGLLISATSVIVCLILFLIDLLMPKITRR